jgi:hypothetical protein
VGLLVIYALEGDSIEAVVDGAPTGLVGTLTFEVYDPTFPDVVVFAPTTTGITEVRSGSYAKTFTIAFAGTYRVRWSFTADGSTRTAEEDLQVGDVETGTRPSVATVALLLRTRTVGPSSGGLGGDTAPGELTTFTDSTRPSATEVDAVIGTASDAVMGMLRKPIPDSETDSVRHAIALYAAIIVETSFFRESSNAEALAALRGMLSDTVAQINETVVLSQGRSFGTLRTDTILSGSRRQLSNDVIEGLDT